MNHTIRTHRRQIATGLALPLFVVLVAACRWAVPADPGLNARLRQRPTAYVSTATQDADALQDDGAREIYLQRCGRCHAPYAPGSLSAARWPAMVRKYAPRAGLYGADRERVERWLVANAGR